MNRGIRVQLVSREGGYRYHRRWFISVAVETKNSPFHTNIKQRVISAHVRFFFFFLFPFFFSVFSYIVTRRVDNKEHRDRVDIHRLKSLSLFSSVCFYPSTIFFSPCFFLYRRLKFCSGSHTKMQVEY